VKPTVLLTGEDWRIVRVELDAKRRESPDDDGIRDLIEVTDGKDLLGNQRWKQLDAKHEGVARYHQICHAMKRMLLECVAARNQETT
jgi:hypothetical protein